MIEILRLLNRTNRRSVAELNCTDDTDICLFAHASLCSFAQAPIAVEALTERYSKIPNNIFIFRTGMNELKLLYIYTNTSHP